MKTQLKFGLFALCLLGEQLVFAQGSTEATQANDKVIFHFATVGDSRHEPGSDGLSAQDAIWLQNTKVLSRMLREIQVLAPQALIFNGDMIYGYSAEKAVLDKQYAFWRGLMAHLMESGTYVLPVPGNHEVQIKQKTAEGKTNKVAVVSSENAWRANMGDLILDQARWNETVRIPVSAWQVAHTPAIGQDGITTNQQQLSYSFDIGTIHLAMINTDPVGLDSSAPVEWLRADFAAAQARGAKQFFVFGHKVAFTYAPNQVAGKDGAASGFDSRKALRDSFWDVIEAYQATYFTGHQHVYHAEQPRKSLGGKAWQVIVGSGGSPLGIPKSAQGNPFDRYYAWADVQVFASGKVHIKALGFDEKFGPTQLMEEWDIAP